MYFVKDTHQLPKDCPVSWFLEQAVEDIKINEDTGPTLIQFSVTSREERYQEWLDAIAGVPGATVTSIQRTERERTVFLCTFPTQPIL